jgi:hypothetical protein
MVQVVERERAMASPVRARFRAVRASRTARGKHASHVAGPGEAFDRGHQEPDRDSESARCQGDCIIDKSEGDFRSERLHFENLRVK